MARPIRTPTIFRFFIARSLIVLIVISFPTATGAIDPPTANTSMAVRTTAMKVTEQDLGVSKPVTSFVVPLGATINMDGTAIMQAVATVFIAQVFAVSLDFTQLLTIILTATLASIGTAGVPGVGMIMLAMVLTSVGLPVEGIQRHVYDV